MDGKERPKIVFIDKGIKEKKERLRQKVDPSSAHIEESPEIVYKVPGTKLLLSDGSKDDIGTMYLWENDPVIDDSVKLKQIMIDDSYQGGGAVDILYNKAVEVARKNHKNLVLDCKASTAAFKSFKRFATENNLEIIENERNVFNDKTNSYEAPNGEWTLKLILEK